MFRRISDMIGRHRVFLITSHERLDGDALGSELALSICCGGSGKRSPSIIRTGRRRITFSSRGSDGIVRELPPLEPFEVAFILDCSELDRIGKESASVGLIPNLVNIDHHVSNGGSVMFG